MQMFFTRDIQTFHLNHLCAKLHAIISFWYFHIQIIPQIIKTLMNISPKKTCLDIDEKLDKRDLALVKISDTGAGEEYGEEF